MNQHLALTVLTHDQPNTLAQLTEFLASHHCQIHSSRMLVLGGEFAMLLLIAGPWNEIAKLESHLPEFSTKHDLIVQFKRTELQHHDNQKWIPYSVELIAHDCDGLIETMSSFFTDLGAVIYEVHNNHYTANPIGIPMFSLAMRILVPADTQLSDLRERFINICDFLNVDAYLEPERA
jgi:glycine cleavage system transcriptional repressor